jgi:hypothetical protein
MTDDLRARLCAELHRVDWKPLAPHAKRGGLVMVAPELDLIDVGAAVAGDDGRQVQNWMRAHQLRRPTETELEAWQDEAEERFVVLIVQPYVLVQRDDFGGETPST